MLFTESHYKFMHFALREAQKAFEYGEVPVGAVVVHEDKIIGRGYNQAVGLKDPTAHAEIIAITAACNNLERQILNDCSIYVTLEPCVMCTGAILLARIENLFFGAFEPKFGACGSVYNIGSQRKYNHNLKIFSGILEDECSLLMKNFFEKKRE